MLSTPNMPDLDAATPPAGFEPLHRSGAWSATLGPIFRRVRSDGGWLIGLFIDERHLNMQGMAHGGMLATLADSALGMNIAIARGTRQAQVTVSLTLDYLAAARRGDWLEAHVEITRMGRTLAFANCELRAADRQVLRASAVFAFVDRPPLPLRDGLPGSDG